ncbi:MAG TPA: sulfite exporter TauE/SafE family protein [Bacillota bacterium]|nr:sulfite exporter TauE/SafE family protein [Bacillota bacterium]
MVGLKKMGIGLFTGFINGLIGVGGTLLVPALIHILGTERKTAHGTSLAIIFPISLISIIIYRKYGVMPYRIGFLISIGGLIGGYIGAKLLRRISTLWLKRIFATLMIYAGIRMLWT